MLRSGSGLEMHSLLLFGGSLYFWWYYNGRRPGIYCNKCHC